MLIEENPFPTNMFQTESATEKDDSDNAKTQNGPIDDTAPTTDAEPVPASVVVKIGNLECNANGGNSHLRTYKPKAGIADGKWHDGHLRPRRAPKSAVTFN